MGCNTEIDDVCVSGVLLGHRSLADEGFCNIVRSQPRPDFLHHILRLVAVEVAESDGIFQLPERGLDFPAPEIKLFDILG